jgi:hypothetical protein
VEPGFPAAEDIPGDIDIQRLISNFSGNANVVATVISVEQVIKDTPL